MRSGEAAAHTLRAVLHTFDASFVSQLFEVERAYSALFRFQYVVDGFRAVECKDTPFPDSIQEKSRKSCFKDGFLLLSHI